MNDVKRVRTGLVELEYEEVGQGDEVLLLLHGFTGSRDDWREQLPGLGELGRTIAYDQRGHGGSTNTGTVEGYTIGQMAADLYAFVEAQGIERIDLLGHSMGGAVALRFALAHPERLRSLVLMDTAAQELELLPAAMHHAGVVLARKQGTGAIARNMRIAAIGKGRDGHSRLIELLGADGYWERIEAKMSAMDPEAFAALGGCPFDNLQERLAQITCPTLVIVGEEDLSFIEPARVLHQGIAGSRLVEIEGAGHSPQFENASAWLAAIRAHLESVRGAQHRNDHRDDAHIKICGP